jgi:hypothetical protein
MDAPPQARRDVNNGDPRVAALYGLPASEFVTAREALARELRAEGRGDRSAAVHALRRPTVVAWSINQVARTQAARVSALVRVSADVQDAQRRAAGGSAADLRSLSRRRRTLLDELTEAAATLTDNPTAHGAAIAATLDGASLDPDLQPALVAGCLARELPPTARFPVGDPPDATRPAPARTRAAKPARDDLAIRRAEQALVQARARAADADTDARDAAQAVGDGEQRVDATTRRITELQAALDEARVELREAKRHLVDARRAATSARSAQQRATAALRTAERAASDQMS